MKRFLAVTIGLACGALAGTASAGPLDDPGFAKSLTCSACHGAAGNSRSDFMPIIAGMPPAYFKKQIEAYAGGKRPSPEMEPYAKMVVVLGADEVARYFGEQKMQPRRSPWTRLPWRVAGPPPRSVRRATGRTARAMPPC
jgi:cytochrome c553